MKKIILIIFFAVIIFTFLGLFIQNILSNFSFQKSFSNSITILQDDYITDNQRKIDILHYKLYFDLYPERKTLIATAEVIGTVIEQPLSRIDLNFYDNFQITEVTLNGTQSDYKLNDKLFSIPFVADIGDTFVVKISYEGTPQRVGLAGFVFGKRDGIPLVYTLSEPTYASSWFPCNDLPTDKVLMDIKISNDTSMISVSNGILVSSEINDSRKTYHWKTVYPISTYLIALYSSDYETFSDQYISLDGKDTMSLEYYVLPDKLEKAKVDFSEHANILNFFAKTFGEYPFIEEKYGVAEFLWSSGAMENQTITGVASSLIGGKNLFLDFYIHELAHHWWGNAIGPKSWKDIWLNEGFSSYSEALYFEHKSGSSALQSTMRDKYFMEFSGTLAEPGSYLFTNTVYDKGAWLLHMLRWEVGDSSFFEILREYYEKYKYSNASTEDFINICENVSAKNLQKFFHQWLEGEGQIELEYAISFKEENGSINTTIEIEQVQEDYEYYEFPLEIVFNFEKDESVSHLVNVKSSLTIFELTSDSKPTIEFDPNRWLLASIVEK
ncbi:MAG: M1 family metallopeptidase [Ignavibacteria bacterium]|nr:M1 family metallopeptidase [Ignavibacteria bacterium]